MNVLFVDAADSYLGRRKTPYKITPLIGMTYVATLAQLQGHNVKVYDAVIGQKTGVSITQILTEFNPDLVALTSTTPFIEANYRVARIVNQILPRTIVALGGPHASVLPTKCFEECPDLDYIVVGEGEYSFSNLLKHLTKGAKNILISGVLKRGQSFDDLKMSSLIGDLDRLPFPDWSLYKYSDYDRVYSYRLNQYENLFQILFSRGCPYNCSFCYNIFGSTYRFRSANNVLQEIKNAFHNFRARFFDFVDPTMTLKSKRFLELCKALEESQLASEIAWNFETRSDLVNMKLLNHAKKAGCESILFGVESGSQTILDSMGKGTTVEQAWKAIDNAVKAKLQVKATLIVGSPYETHKTLKETLLFVRKVKARYDVEFLPSFLGVYPGTKIFDSIEKGEGNSRWVNGVRNNWQKARRDRPMIEVGDLNNNDLINFMAELKSIIGE